MNYAFDNYSALGGRDINEDSICCVNIEDCFLFVVADGLGGHSSGEVASKIATDELKRLFTKDAYNFNLCAAIESANSLILKAQSEYFGKMKTTITALYINPFGTTVANIGDSRVYLFESDRIVFQTIDHSASQAAVNDGVITQKEIRNHCDRNILTKALGVSQNLKIDINEFHNHFFDRAILCSDGFWEYVLEEEMESTALSSKNPDVWLYKMREKYAQKAPIKSDNNSAIVVIRK